MNQGFLHHKSKFALVFILLLTSLTGFSQNSQPFSINESPLPAPTGPVMDYVGVLDANAKQTLERRLIEFRDKTNPKVEMAVAVVNTTGERPIFDYSLAVARGWKIGSKDDDNPSLLLVVAVNDRKAYVQVSKDLEDELPDGLVTSLQRQYLVPALRQNNYGKGITDLFEAYIRAIESKQTGEPVAGTATNQTRRQEKGSSRWGCGTVVCLIILFIVLISIFSRFGSNKKRGGGDDDDNWRGGGFGGGTGGVLPWIIGSAIANSIGNSGGSSGGWGGGGDSGGGDSWGGFGGGGDFGGGGGGSDW